MGFSLAAVSEGLSRVVVCQLLTAVASLGAEHRLSAHKLGACGTWAQELQHTDLVAPQHVESSCIRD